MSPLIIGFGAEPFLADEAVAAIEKEPGRPRELTLVQQLRPDRSNVPISYARFPGSQNYAPYILKDCS